MTKLQELYKSKGLDALKEEISKYSTSQLFEELDDTIQFDILNANHEKWVIDLMNEKKVYLCIIHELQERIRLLEIKAPQGERPTC